MKIEEIKTAVNGLNNMYCIEFLFDPSKYSLAATIVNAKLPYMPGVYLVYGFENNKIGKSLYVGKAGANKKGIINTHQVPKRLLAVCYPPQKYLDGFNKRNITRNVLWPKMMERDNINAIKIYCFFSEISSDLNVTSLTNPSNIESSINNFLSRNNFSQSWSKKYSTNII